MNINRKCKGCGAPLGNSAGAWCVECNKKAAFRNLRESRNRTITAAVKTLSEHGIKLRPARPSDNRDVRVSPDGDKWCCLLGDNLQVGVAGFGDTPEAACLAFDNAWSIDAAALDAAKRRVTR